MDRWSLLALSDRFCRALIVLLILFLCLFAARASLAEGGTKRDASSPPPGLQVFQLAQRAARDITAAPPVGDRRVALVIGNGRYAAGPLNSPGNAPGRSRAFFSPSASKC
jgi:hypothetical protein